METTASLPAQFSGWVTERLRQLYADHHNAVPALGAERAIHYTEFFKEHARKFPSPHLRMAHALRYHLEQRTIRIFDGELLVGTHTEHRIGAICQIELTGSFMLEDIFHFPTRRVNPLKLDARTRSKLLWGCMPYWFTRNLVMKAFPFIERIRYSIAQLNAKDFIVNEAGGIAHFLPDFEGIIHKGTEGLREETLARFQHAELSAEQRDFLDARLVVIEALEAFASRYKNLARTMGRADLVSLLERSPRKPAATVREALQTIWFFQMVIQIESLDQGISLGRIDQYLMPLYAAEKKSGTIDEDSLKNLLCAFCLKLSEVIPLLSARITQYHGGLPSGQAATIGGLTSDGKCAANALTFAILSVMDEWRVRQPNWHARISKDSSPAYVSEVMRVVAAGGGSPALYNDEVIVEALKERGFPAGHLHNYATVGCVEPAIPGMTFTSSDAAIVNLPLAMERIFKDPARAKKINSLDHLLEEFEREIRRITDALHGSLSAIERAHRLWHPTPFSSLTVDGCLQKTLDLTAGGAVFNASGIQGVGLADVADSIHAINTLVFEKESYTMKALVEAVNADFSSKEKSSRILAERLRALRGYGNGESAPDMIASRVAEIVDRVISGYPNTRGGNWIPGLYSMTAHRAFGARTGALPSGRRKGNAFADGIACVDGHDLSGPTAAFNSAARLPASRFANGVNLNAKFDARLFHGPEGAVVLTALVKSYFQQGGMQVQLNVVDPGILIDAMNNPEKHRNLLVRVSGYCAYFADLSVEMQREIIERTSHGLPA